jgi:hypothetical protein
MSTSDDICSSGLARRPWIRVLFPGGELDHYGRYQRTAVPGLQPWRCTSPKDSDAHRGAMLVTPRALPAARPARAPGLTGDHRGATLVFQCNTASTQTTSRCNEPRQSVRRLGRRSPCGTSSQNYSAIPPYRHWIFCVGNTPAAKNRPSSPHPRVIATRIQQLLCLLSRG